jgi:hypothetical protein
MLEGLWEIILFIIALVLFYIPVGILVFFCTFGFLTGMQKIIDTRAWHKMQLFFVSLFMALIVTGTLFYLFYLY